MVIVHHTLLYYVSQHDIVLFYATILLNTVWAMDMIIKLLCLSYKVHSIFSSYDVKQDMYIIIYGALLRL